MADLGTIGHWLGGHPGAASYWAQSPAIAFDRKAGDARAAGHSAAFSPADGDLVAVGFLSYRRASGTTAVSGTTAENGSPVSGVRVRAFARDTGALLGEAVSDASGAWTIQIVGAVPAGNLTVVAYDKAGGNAYNALVFDLV